MKRSLLPLFVILPLLWACSPETLAQSSPDDDRMELRSPFEWLVPYDCGGPEQCLPAGGPGTATGLLANIGALFFDPLEYSGTLQDPVVPGATWGMLVGQLALSELPGHGGLIPSHEDLTAAVDVAHAAGVWPIGLMAVRYEYLDDVVTDPGNKLFELSSDSSLAYIGVPGAIPYVENVLFAAGALGEHLSSTVEAGQPVTFRLDPALFVTTPASGPITGIAVNLDDGQGYRAATLGSTFSTSYPALGRRILTVRAQFEGSTRYTRTTVVVRPEQSSRTTCELTTEQVALDWECFDHQSEFIQSNYGYDAPYYNPGGNDILAQYAGYSAARYRYAIFYADDLGTRQNLEGAA